MLHERYYIEKEKQEKLLARKNEKSDFYNGVFDRYEYPVLTREHIPLTWRYDLNPDTNPYFMERLGINAVMNSGAIELNGKYYLVARIEGNDRKSFFGVAESDNGIDGFRFWDYPILLPDTCLEETNVYDMRLTKHEDGYIYGVFCSESKDTSVSDLSAAVAAAGIVRTKDLIFPAAERFCRAGSACRTSSRCVPRSRETWCCIRNSSTANMRFTRDRWMILSRREAAEASDSVSARTSHTL